MEMLCSIDYKSLSPLDTTRAFFLALFDTYRANPFSLTITLDQGLHGGSHVRYHHQVEKLREDFYVRVRALHATGYGARGRSQRSTRAVHPIFHAVAVDLRRRPAHR